MSKLCIECQSEIPDGAVKCVHCDAYQTWRRYIRFSNTFLSLLVALVSVSGLVIPIIYKSFEDGDSHLASQVLSIGEVMGRYRSSGLSADTDEEAIAEISYCVSFSVLVQNSGSAPGVIKKLDIWLHAGDSIAASGTYLVPSMDAVLKPDDYRAIEAKVVLSPKIREMFPAKLVIQDDRRILPFEYSKGKVMAHFLRSDGTEWREQHTLPGSISEIRFERGSCEPD